MTYSHDSNNGRLNIRKLQIPRLFCARFCNKNQTTSLFWDIFSQVFRYDPNTVWVFTLDDKCPIFGCHLNTAPFDYLTVLTI